MTVVLDVSAHGHVDLSAAPVSFRRALGFVGPEVYVCTTCLDRWTRRIAA